MTQKSDWTRRQRIRARLEDSDQIADFCRRPSYRAAQGVQRSAQGTNDIHSFSLGNIELVQDGHGKVALDDLSQVSRSSEVMIHASIQNYVLLSTRGLNVSNSRDVHTSLAHQKTPRLDHEFGIREARVCNALEELFLACAQLPHIQF